MCGLSTTSASDHRLRVQGYKGEKLCVSLRITLEVDKEPPKQLKNKLKTKMCKSETQVKMDQQLSVEDKLGQVTKMMRQVRDLGTSHKTEDISVAQRRMLQILAEIEDIRDDLINLVSRKISHKQLEFLKDTNQGDIDVSDPSVQFFGVEWNTIFAKCFNLGLNIRIFKQRMTADCVDITGLACILSDLTWVTRQMELHSVALRSGVLTPGHLARQLHQQMMVTAAGPDTQSRKSKKVFVKYNRKHKTENLSKIFPSEEDVQRRRSFDVLHSSQRKSTFLENISHLLSYIKH